MHWIEDNLNSDVIITSGWQGFNVSGQTKFLLLVQKILLLGDADEIVRFLSRLI